ncbi:unnamed protein product [Clonostachys byssicola]|uniref:Uncharacterized protein n=1 Tax=Clonostachys byssicola TaxID=160290 RepID=A0A9N9UK20_9HYPO|nr:unnamed protein product [Clonostachys byssicola]
MSTEQPATDADGHKGDHLLFPQPGDGKLIPMVIQSLQQPSVLPENVPWTRLGEPFSKVGTMEAIWYWVLSPILVKGSEKVDVSPGGLFFLILRFLAAAPLCAFMKYQEQITRTNRDAMSIPHAANTAAAPIIIIAFRGP